MSGLSENLRRLLSPKHIAFIGGSDADFSARQCAQQFDGPVWGVNPNRETLGGVRTDHLLSPKEAANLARCVS